MNCDFSNSSKAAITVSRQQPISAQIVSIFGHASSWAFAWSARIINTGFRHPESFWRLAQLIALLLIAQPPFVRPRDATSAAAEFRLGNAALDLPIPVRLTHASLLV
jgi:hypothetical protein